MVSKTRKQKMKIKTQTQANNGVRPTVVPDKPKSIHLKKTRPNMKGKKKVRLGLECPIDIYEGFEDIKGVKWTCPTCQRLCRTVGFCTDCATGVKSKVAVPQKTSATSAKKAPLQSGKKTLKFKKKH